MLTWRVYYFQFGYAGHLVPVRYLHVRVLDVVFNVSGQRVDVFTLVVHVTVLVAGNVLVINVLARGYVIVDLHRFDIQDDGRVEEETGPHWFHSADIYRWIDGWLTLDWSLTFLPGRGGRCHGVGAPLLYIFERSTLVSFRINIFFFWFPTTASGDESNVNLLIASRGRRQRGGLAA